MNTVCSFFGGLVSLDGIENRWVDDLIRQLVRVGQVALILAKFQDRQNGRKEGCTFHQLWIFCYSLHGGNSSRLRIEVEHVCLIRAEERGELPGNIRMFCALPHHISPAAN